MSEISGRVREPRTTLGRRLKALRDDPYPVDITRVVTPDHAQAVKQYNEDVKAWGERHKTMARIRRMRWVGGVVKILADNLLG